jgi:hypothetical protein
MGAGSSTGGNAGGASVGHMSAQGMKNSNSPTAGDRDKGLARAEDRSDTQADRTGDTDSTSSKSKPSSKTAKTHHHFVRKPTTNTEHS